MVALQRKPKSKKPVKSAKASKPLKKPWSKMTAAERRVAVAKDVIYLLSRRKMVAEPGEYLDTSPVKSSSMSMRDILLANINKKCKCCGIGACFVSTARLNDKIILDHLNQDRDGRLVTGGRDDFSRSCRGTFSEKTLSQIEAIFEVWEYDANFPDVHGTTSAPLHSIKPADRLRLIMRNIINNLGQFKAKACVIEMLKFAGRLAAKKLKK